MTTAKANEAGPAQQPLDLTLGSAIRLVVRVLVSYTGAEDTALTAGLVSALGPFFTNEDNLGVWETTFDPVSLSLAGDSDNLVDLLAQVVGSLDVGLHTLIITWPV